MGQLVEFSTLGFLFGPIIIGAIAGLATTYFLPPPIVAVLACFELYCAKQNYKALRKCNGNEASFFYGTAWMATATMFLVQIVALIRYVVINSPSL